MGVGVKRQIPMLNENPVSNIKAHNVENKMTNNNLEGGPTIHELDNEIEILHENSLESHIARNNEETKISDLVPDIILSDNETSTEKTNINLSQSIRLKKKYFLIQIPETHF